MTAGIKAETLHEIHIERRSINTNIIHNVYTKFVTAKNERAKEDLYTGGTRK